MIEKLIPSYNTFVDPIGGTKSLIYYIHPFAVETYNDITSDVYDVFYVMRDDELFLQFKAVSDGDLSPSEAHEKVQKAWRYYSEVIKNFGDRLEKHPVFFHTENKRIKAIKNFYYFYQRIIRVQIEHDTFENVVKRFDTSNTFFYIDPTDFILKGELTPEVVVNTIQNISGKAMLVVRNDIKYPIENWKQISGFDFCGTVDKIFINYEPENKNFDEKEQKYQLFLFK